jgi:hypothetical protein
MCTGNIILWLQPKNLIEKILMLFPHRDTHITYNTHILIHTYLESLPINTLEICLYQKAWKGSPDKGDIQNQTVELNHLMEKNPDPHNVTPKQVMWERI